MDQSAIERAMQAMDMGVIEGAMEMQAMDVRKFDGVIDGATDASDRSESTPRSDGSESKQWIGK